MRITVAASNGVEGQPGCEFVFLANKPAKQPTTIRFRIGGTAKIGVDYKSIPNSVTLSRGETRVSLPIETIDDSKLEGNETIIVYLTPGKGYRIGPQSTATAAILDNDCVRYLHETIDGTRVKETSTVTINEMQARIIQLEVSMNDLILSLAEATARIEELGMQIEADA